MEKLLNLDQDSILMAVSPMIFAGKKLLAEKRRRYGAGRLEPMDAPVVDVPTLCGLIVGLAVVIGLWIVPMVRAFRCPTNAALSITWGLLILFFGPLVGVLFLLVGCPVS